jgi:uncharacterized phage infection (PIP) family protein YhgE
VSFFLTNDSVLTALKASFTGLVGLHESTQSLEAMKEGVSKSIEVLSQLGDKVQEAAVRAVVIVEKIDRLTQSIARADEEIAQIRGQIREVAQGVSKSNRHDGNSASAVMIIPARLSAMRQRSTMSLAAFSTAR